VRVAVISQRAKFKHCILCETCAQILAETGLAPSISNWN